MCRPVHGTLLVIFVSVVVMSPPSSALGPVQIDIRRADGLCSLLVLPLRSYDCVEYSVQTDDGFLIGVQRVSSRVYSGQLKGPALILHGILLGGDVWFLNPSNQAFGTILADAGFDLWVANTRTTRFSYGHVSYNKNDKGFWDWSVDELARYDVPAMLELVHQQTSKKVDFIGYSQGTQQAIVAFSQSPQLPNEMVNRVVFIAPIAYLNDVGTAIGKVAATLYADRLYDVFHIYEFSTRYRQKELVDIICGISAERCYRTFVSLFTGNNCCLNYSRRAIVDTYETQSTATKNIRHVAQQVRQKTFAMFDYGLWGNLIRYWRLRPPAYSVGDLPTSINVLFLHGGQDTLSDPTDVTLLFSLLHANPARPSFPVCYIPEYAHIDFILGTNAKGVVYDKIMAFLDS